MKVLALDKSNWFAKGLQIYEKEHVEEIGAVKYKHGEHTYFSLKPLKEWPVDELKLSWVEMHQKRKITAFEKIKKFFSKKEPDLDITVRPENSNIVIVDYGFDFIEIAEFNHYGDHYHWTTELYTGLPVKRWAYIPEDVIDMAEHKKEVFNL